MEIPDYVSENRIFVGFLFLGIVLGVSGFVFMMGQDSPVESSDSDEDMVSSEGYQPLEYDRVQEDSGYNVFGEVSVESYEGGVVYNPLDSTNDNSDMSVKILGQSESEVETLDSSRLIERDGKRFLAFNFDSNPAFKLEGDQKLSIENPYFEEVRQQNSKETSLDKFMIGGSCDCLLISQVREVDTSDFEPQDFRLEGSIESDSNFFIPDEDVVSNRVVVSSEGDYLGEFELDGTGEEEDFSVVLEDVKKPVQTYKFQYKPSNESVASAKSDMGLYNTIETIERFGSYGFSESGTEYQLTVSLEKVSVVN